MLTAKAIPAMIASRVLARMVPIASSVTPETTAPAAIDDTSTA